jgi:hypothetical protein
MWRLKIKLEAKNQFLGNLAIKYKVSITGYPLSYWKDKKNLYLMQAGFVFGEEKNIALLKKEIKKLREILEIEWAGDFALMVTKQPLFTEPVYNPKIIRPSPVIIHQEGYHIWDLASFDKKALNKVIDFAEKHLGAKIISFKEEKISNISFTRLLPELSDKQKKALEIAINNGYYDYPKRVKMESLAKIMKISYSTYQAHLKKAEGKILPEIFKEL